MRTGDWIQRQRERERDWIQRLDESKKEEYQTLGFQSWDTRSKPGQQKR